MVLRDIDATKPSTTDGGGFQLYGNIGNVLWYANYTVNTYETFQWRGRQVFETGQMFQIVANSSSSTPGWDFQCSGYLLKLP